MSEGNTESRQADEPSMEEILASIRRIVFENDGAAGDRETSDGRDAAESGSPAEAPVRPAERGDPVSEDALSGEPAAGKFDRSEETGPPDNAASPEPPKSGDAHIHRGTDAAPAGPESAGSDTGPDDTVLLLTEMIAPDGSVVRIGPQARQAQSGNSPPAEDPALDAATQGELAAMLREWLDQNVPDIVDRAARDELRKLADRLEGTPANRQD